MKCPLCNCPLTRKPGGQRLLSGPELKYYHCSECDIDIRVSGNIVKILDKEEPFKYRSIEKARKALVDMMRIDCQLLRVKGLASQIDKETQELAESIRRMKG
jgi:hypothetical protein